jgi:hypothetical protein
MVRSVNSGWSIFENLLWVIFSFFLRGNGVELIFEEFFRKIKMKKGVNRSTVGF